MSNQYVDVVIIGTGISGISAAYYLQTMCPEKSFIMLEARGSIGGTWDLFKYPGIRSDSDMYTLGFEFRPWLSTKAIADGPSIMDYLNGSIEDYKLEEYIRFGHSVDKASWSTQHSKWTITSNLTDGGQSTYDCQFIFCCTGYYNYEKGYTPEFKGLDSYKGTFIHPQLWPEDLEYSDKKMVVIGSGATAITLIPELAERASQVTMLQRSPTYVTVAPAEDKVANWMNRTFSQKLAYRITRWRKIRMGQFFYKLAKKYPSFMKGLIIKGVTKELGEDYDVATHFTPKYNPWDQRHLI